MARFPAIQDAEQCGLGGALPSRRSWLAGPCYELRKRGTGASGTGLQSVQHYTDGEMARV